MNYKSKEESIKIPNQNNKNQQKLIILLSQKARYENGSQSIDCSIEGYIHREPNFLKTLCTCTASLIENEKFSGCCHLHEHDFD